MFLWYMFHIQMPYRVMMDQWICVCVCVCVCVYIGMYIQITLLFPIQTPSGGIVFSTVEIHIKPVTVFTFETKYIIHILPLFDGHPTSKYSASLYCCPSYHSYQRISQCMQAFYMLKATMLTVAVKEYPICLYVCLWPILSIMLTLYL
jgi:hypothetical protein